MNKQICRGDIYLANLNPYRGSEQGGTRPVVIIQNNTGNHYGPTVIVAAITSRVFKKIYMPTHVPLDMVVLEKHSQVMLEQIRTIDKSRLIEKLGKVTDEDMKSINQALIASLGLENSEDTK